ncbi:Butyrophilin-like protein 2 [Labeo rohita]|uniref:Butyrophilin-like protein 2 n=1 Tax=Labeo rohita TaxID=84645 RepID=A0ABQ8MVX9_LABRO|nr:Butyrophilin-like protein 2 [Labeo rohita]
MKGLKVEWRKTDSGTLVHLYQDGESRPEAQQQDYHDRAHFFTDQIQHGNFSLHLDNLTAEDQGRYTCKIYSQQDSGETVVQIKYVEHLLVSGSDESVSASVGEDVTLKCSVNSPITPEHNEEVLWKKTDKDEHILVLLYQNNKTLSDSSNERYKDRVEFFTAKIPKGNFSLRLKSVRTEDKGVYMCQVFAGGLSANATIVLETLGEYLINTFLCLTHNGVDSLRFCIWICTFALLPDLLQGSFNHLFLWELQQFCLVMMLRVNRSRIIMIELTFLNFSLPLDKLRDEDAIILFAFTSFWAHCAQFFWPSSSSGPAVLRLGSSGVLPCYVNRRLLEKTRNVEWRRTDSQTLVHLCLDDESQSQQDYHDRAHFFTDQIQHGNFSLRLDKLRAEDEGEFTCKVYRREDSVSRQEDSVGKRSGQILSIFDLVADTIFDILPTLQFILLFFTFASVRGGSLSVIRTVMLIIKIVIVAVVNAIGWGCVILFLQLLWTVMKFTGCYGFIAQDFPRVVPVYVFGSVGVVLLNSAALMTELILKTVNGARTVGDLRSVVFPSECFFAASGGKDRGLAEWGDTGRSGDQGRTEGKEDPFGAKGVEGCGAAGTLWQNQGDEGASRIPYQDQISPYLHLWTHITPEHIEEASWKKTDEDKDILVLLYQNNETLSDSSDERYRDRVEFFTAEIHKGNFSLRLKSVRIEDKGVYMCQVFAGGLSANATVVLHLCSAA